MQINGTVSIYPIRSYNSQIDGPIAQKKCPISHAEGKEIVDPMVTTCCHQTFEKESLKTRFLQINSNKCANCQESVDFSSLTTRTERIHNQMKKHFTFSNAKTAAIRIAQLSSVIFTLYTLYSSSQEYQNPLGTCPILKNEDYLHPSLDQISYISSLNIQASGIFHSAQNLDYSRIFSFLGKCWFAASVRYLSNQDILKFELSKIGAFFGVASLDFIRSQTYTVQDYIINPTIFTFYQKISPSSVSIDFFKYMASNTVPIYLLAKVYQMAIHNFKYSIEIKTIKIGISIRQQLDHENQEAHNHVIQFEHLNVPEERVSTIVAIQRLKNIILEKSITGVGITLAIGTLCFNDYMQFSARNLINIFGAFTLCKSLSFIPCSLFERFFNLEFRMLSLIPELKRDYFQLRFTRETNIKFRELLNQFVAN